MSLISGSIPNLINGVSQQPSSLRLKTQAQKQINGLSTVVEGLKKRPPTEHIRKLDGTSDLTNAFVHVMRRDENEWYYLIITDNNIRVIDKDGADMPMVGGAGYLSGISQPQTQISATTIADFTFILNKTKTVEAGTSLTQNRNPESLIYVKQGDYKTDYIVSVYNENGSTKATASLTTQDSSNASNASDIRTNTIASRLRNTLNGVSGLTASLYGSVVYLTRTDGQDFRIKCTDSRGDRFLLGFKDQTSDYVGLPTDGPTGFQIRVTGDSAEGQDDYYVQLADPAGFGQKVWKETVAQGIVKGLNPDTMPHQLIRAPDGYFVFAPASGGFYDYQSHTIVTTEPSHNDWIELPEWFEREVGDDDTNPMPSFVDYEISDIFFHRNRMGLLADENVILSESGNYYNFFASTVLTALDSNPVDVAVSNNQVSILRHAIPFSEQLLIFSDLTQFVMKSTDILTPETVSIDVTTQFEASLRAKPVSAGKYVFFATKRGKWSGMREYFVESDNETNDAADITSHVPSFIEGEVRSLTASSNEDSLLVLTDDQPNNIFIYRYYWSGSEKLQSSWSVWDMGARVLACDFNLSEIIMLIQRDDGVYLEKLNLSTDRAEVDTAFTNNDGDEIKFGVNLDRRVTLRTPAQAGEFTSVPYTAPSDLIYVSKRGRIIEASDVAAELALDNPVFAGTPYRFEYVFSEQVIKEENEPITIGRVQLRNFNLVYNDTGFFETRVTPKKRDTSVSTFGGRIVGGFSNVIGYASIASGTFRFPVLSKSDQVEIKIQSDSFLPCVFQSAEWEAFYTLRSRRL